MLGRPAARPVSREPPNAEFQHTRKWVVAPGAPQPTLWFKVVQQPPSYVVCSIGGACLMGFACLRLSV